MAFFALHFLLTSRNGHGASRRVFNVLAYGAKGDGVVNNTLAFRAAAIATANAARLSSDRDRCTVSATMLVPPGRFLTGSFRLSSCVSLELAAGAVLLASNAIGDYPPDGWNWDPAFIDVYNASFVTITGDGGAIDGQALPLWAKGFDPLRNMFLPITWAGVHGCVGECRPKLLRFVDCDHVRVAGITLRNSPDWTQLYRRCSDVLLERLTVIGSSQWGNNDGVDFESGRNIVVRDSDFDVGDDGIVFASGNTNPVRLKAPCFNTTAVTAPPLENVLVENCSIRSHSSAMKWEAIDFGRCNHGDIRNVTVRRVRIHNSSRGLGFQMRSGTGSFRDIRIEDSTVEAQFPTGTNWWGSGEAIWISIVAEDERGSPTSSSRVGTIRNLSFINVVARGENSVLIAALGFWESSSSSSSSSSGGGRSNADDGRGPPTIAFVNTTLELVVAGNATCAKGMAKDALNATSAGVCVDLRPVSTAASRKWLGAAATSEGGDHPGVGFRGGAHSTTPLVLMGRANGSVVLQDVTLRYRIVRGDDRAATRPESWSTTACVRREGGDAEGGGFVLKNATSVRCEGLR